MKVRTVAPAKINWTLEVLGKRDDGYHEIRSVMQTIDLCDEVTVGEGTGNWEQGAAGSEEEGRRKKEEGLVIRTGSATLVVEGAHEATEDDLSLRAVRALEEVTGRDLPVAITLVKRIPVAAGLGGGSSDAAAVLRAVNRLYGLGLSREELAAVGAGIGSDVPFFVYGGTMLVEGRGERVTQLPEVGETWVVVVVPAVALEQKTANMYARLTESDFTDGSRVEGRLEFLRENGALHEGHCNVFERYVFEAVEGLEALGDDVWLEMLDTFNVAGAGPAIFTSMRSRERADETARYAYELARGLPQVGPSEYPPVEAFVAGTMGAVEATALDVSE